MDCAVLINYGGKTEIVTLVKNDEIRWNDNVIILQNNMNHYRHTVSTKQLIITCKNDSLKKIPYISPTNEVSFCGHGWFDM